MSPESLNKTPRESVYLSEGPYVGLSINQSLSLFKKSLEAYSQESAETLGHFASLLKMRVQSHRNV